jgi:hypothetical protein
MLKLADLISYIIDIEFVTTDGNIRPTPENSKPLEEGDHEGRGSVVFFNQASMYAASETGHGTIAAANQLVYLEPVISS